MKKYALLIMALLSNQLFSQNPLIMNQFTADPTARVFDGKVYLYPSHDILASEGKGRPNWFCMEDYHVFSSENLSDWTDHGIIVRQTKVPWANPEAYSMWAPDCIFRAGKYYFYFPTAPGDTVYGRGFAIGVAVADNPAGPFIPESKPIKNVHGIDPNVFIGSDGQAYLFWSARNIYGAKLKENMLELASEPVIIGELPEKGLKEGPFMFERKGIYYLTYPHVENKIERLEYATGDNPLGPFKMTGVIMDESTSGCWTNHHSIINYKNQWYLFYHDKQLSPNFDKNRSVKADSLFFAEDGSILKVVPSIRGVGVTNAENKVQIDRYSAISKDGISIEFLDSTDTFMGWKARFEKSGAWLRYNKVDFSTTNLKNVLVNVKTAGNSSFEIYLDGLNRTLLALVSPEKSNEWHLIQAKLNTYKEGSHDLYIISKSNVPFEIDWLTFGN